MADQLFVVPDLRDFAVMELAPHDLAGGDDAAPGEHEMFETMPTEVEPMMLSASAVRVLTTAALALTGVWLAMLAAGAIAASHGAPITMQMWMVSLCPGCAFVPALFYLRRRRRSEDPKKIRDFTGLAVTLTLMGVVILGSTVYSLAQMYPG